LALLDRGINPEPALRAAHLSRRALMEVDNRLPRAAMQAFWEAAAQAAGDRSFGVHVAEGLRRGCVDLVDYLLYASTNVGEGLARLAQYVRILYDRSNLRLVTEPKHARLIRRVTVPSPQYDEFTLTLILDRSRRATGIDWVPDRATFQHARPHDDGELARVMRCPIQFSAERIELRFPHPILGLPHIHHDSRLLEILLRYADQQLAALPAGGDIVTRASSAIARQIASSVPTLASTATSLRLHPRTLQRRLAAAGQTHQALVDDVRRGLALKYMGDAGLSVNEIAYLLHFSDATAFARAFKRWTGALPLQYRQQVFTTA
jgi:AraC-like DNA-binding protein